MTTITVTDRDIARGIRQNSENCPEALAASRTLGQPVAVNHHGVYTKTPVPGPSYHFVGESPEAVAALQRFDATGIMSPFSFEIEAFEAGVVS